MDFCSRPDRQGVGGGEGLETALGSAATEEGGAHGEDLVLHEGDLGSAEDEHEFGALALGVPEALEDRRQALVGFAEVGELVEDEDEAFDVYFGSVANAPYANRAEAMASPLFEKVTRRARDRWQSNHTKEAHYEYLRARDMLMTRLLQVMADHQLDAIVHKAVEHQPTLIKDGVNPPFVDQKGAPHINTFLVFVPSVVVPAGFTRDDLPAGITFLGRPYDDANMLRFAYAYEQATHHRRVPANTP